jgi:Fanconi anemia group M protein
MKIIIDHRESRGSLPVMLEKLGLDLDIQTLEIGDFIISEDVVVELKNIGDFVNSLVDGRLFSQAKELKENFLKPLYIIEGDLDDLFEVRNVHPNAIRAAMISLLLDYQIPFIYTSSKIETANILHSLVKREQKDGERSVGLRGSKRMWTLEEKQQFLIEGLPLVGPKLAKNLLKEFKSPAKILCANEDELLNIEKLGPKKYKLIKEILDLEGEH